ncbi:WD40/YVTN/BNR-like repeat-containing protein [Gloeocapsopsis dulcis]|uniref:Photosynthesis system II assembly factor Ycf48/Hcf136-like domain-containing protein n=1 Tax=Gloeocapsopsis dulcis AAB1 = 1H9 TaxID=1433147 RepID=A0A6N8FXV6_9CHRO|nr:hypothetical protein [Gloeocapsopsis dulcis]MUL36977.1 hypothetical protein [Gloeocapsopsis dulcis AAB1 = 1H9]WNN88793.1 hypothetical protein P0S91_21380 [Gloeocapsopsis dulcis]
MLKLLARSKKFHILILTILSPTVFLSNNYAVLAHAPHDVVTDLEISPTYDQDQTLFSIVRGNLLRSTNGGSTWKRIVNGLDNRGNLSSLAISSHSKQFLFLSSNRDGIYKSQNGGSSWFKVNNGLGNLSIGLLAMSADNNQVVFAAGTKNHLYRTINGGESWQQVRSDASKITTISAFPNKYVLTGNDQGIVYLSTDGGNVWSRSFQFSNSGGITAIAVSPNFSFDRTFFVGTQTGGIFRTTNGGNSFLAVSNGVTDKSIRSLVISPNYRTDSTIFASTWNEAIFQSNNRGNTWTKYSQGLTKVPQADTYQEPHFSDLKISKSFAKDKTMFLGGFDGVFKSINSGVIWKPLDTLSTKLIMSVALSPASNNDSTLAICTYLGGIYKTTNKGITWTAINKGFSSKFRHSNIVFSPNYRSDNIIFISGGTNQISKSIDKGNSWDIFKLNNVSNVTTLPTLIAISPRFASDRTIYVGTRQNGGIFRSTNGAVSSSLVLPSKSPIQSLVISPDFPVDKTLYASFGKGVLKTVDEGKTWQPAGNSFAIFESNVKLAISPNYKVDKTVFVGTNKGLFKTTNGGSNWVKLVGKTYGDDGYVETIAVSPSYQNDRTIIISVKGRGLFKSVNSGTTFVQIAKELINNNHSFSTMNEFPQVSVPIQFSPSYAIDNTIYGTSAEELFQSADGGNTWKLVNIPIR